MNKTQILSIFKKALEAIDPYKAVLSAFKFSDEQIYLKDTIPKDFIFPLKKTANIYVVGCGKAACPMADAVEHVFGQLITSGIVVTKYGHRTSSKSSKIEVIEASHPVPDHNGLIGANRVRDLLKTANKNDLVIALVSGGGSVLWPFPVDGISLDELIQTNQKLLESGAPIHEINSIRKHLSQLQGGKAALLASPATVIVFVMSDVIGDDLNTIASGPFFPDSTSFETALNVIQRYGLEKEIPPSSTSYIVGGIEGHYAETPKNKDYCFDTIYHKLVGTNQIALDAARTHALCLGFDCIIIDQPIHGEVNHAARKFCDQVKTISSMRKKLKPVCIISGGETTVTLKKPYGKGGRNQEFALAAACHIQGQNIMILSCGTDGSDGPTDAAGAVVDGEFVNTCVNLGLNPAAYLANHDSYSLFEKTGNLIKTGPTLTNVMDLQIAVVW